MKQFLHRILQEIMKKNHTWNIRRLVDESFVPATQRIILKIVEFQNNLNIPYWICSAEHQKWLGQSNFSHKKVSYYSLKLKGEKRFSSLDIPLSVQALMEDFMFIDFMRFHMVLCHDPIKVWSQWVVLSVRLWSF